MELIRTFARGEIDASALYTFPLVLCDNEADRDLECFDAQTVEELAGLFVGKSGITDHEWRSGNQIARIYRTEVVRSPERSRRRRGVRRLKDWAYMLRTEMIAALIADIEGGIKTRGQRGCSVRARRCSICGSRGGRGCTTCRGCPTAGCSAAPCSPAPPTPFE